LKKFTTALKGFNLSLLDAFKNRGYEVFVASIYTPFGSGLSTRDLIKKVEALSI
jgi:hypothetical protein